MGMLRMKRSVAMFVKVEMVTLDMLWTAEHKCSPGGGDQLAEMGVHQNAMRNICNRNVTPVNTHAAPSIHLVRAPWEENML